MENQKQHELIIQYLFSLEMGGSDAVLALLQGHQKVSSSFARQVECRALPVWEMRERLDQELEQRSRDYAIERIGVVDKNILRYALYQLEVEKKGMERVVSEAIRVAKKFSSPEAATYIHAVLASSTEAIV